MTVFNSSIAGVAAGDALDVKRTVTNIPATQTLTKAWLTLKVNRFDADAALLQKVITPASVAGVGSLRRKSP